MTDAQPTPEEQAKVEPTPETLARSAETGTEDSVARTVHARRRSPAAAFLIGAAAVGAVGVLAYLFWPDRAETPVSPEESAITDEALGLPAPDAGAIQRQVDQALAATPRDAAQPAEQAASAAQAQTAPEPEDVAPVEPTPAPAPIPGGTAPQAAPAEPDPQVR